MMPKIVCKNNSINTTIRMIAYSDKGSSSSQFIQLKYHIRSIGKHIIVYSQFFQYTMSEAGATKMGMAIV